MHSVVPVCSQWSHMTITYDALYLTVQGRPTPTTCSNLFNLDITVHEASPSPHPDPDH